RQVAPRLLVGLLLARLLHSEAGCCPVPLDCFGLFARHRCVSWFGSGGSGRWYRLTNSDREPTQKESHAGPPRALPETLRSLYRRRGATLTIGQEPGVCKRPGKPDSERVASVCN